MQKTDKQKVFIIGLPRTGTTSVSVAFLNKGLKVAHTAFTKRAFEVADVVSDAPCFSDYRQLDRLFDARFVYLDRAFDQWLPSIQALLRKMAQALDSKSGHFHPVLKRSFHEVFKLQRVTDPLQPDHLRACYQAHQQAVLSYFKERDDFLTIDVSKEDSLSSLLAFTGLEHNGVERLPHLNIGKQVDSWRQLKHANKVSPTMAGIEHQKFFDYSELKS